MMLLGALLILAGNLNLSAGVKTEICNEEHLELTCAADEVIVMTSAEYGRKEVGRCITEHDDFMGCTNDVLGLLDKWCSGRRDCDIGAVGVNLDLISANTGCLKILKLYLEIEYVCRKVAVNQHCVPGSPQALHDQSGVVSSHVTDETGCGSPRSPWIIRANPGQTIDLTLLDFSAADSDGRTSFVTCQRSYGFILERSLGINHTICGGNTRQRVLYHSKTNTIEVNFIQKSRRTDDAKFLIEYTAVGCQDLTPSARAWYKREGNEAVIGCETNDQEWRLTCTGNTWRGTVGNCSVAPVVVAVKEKQHQAEELPVSTLVITTSIIGGAVIVTVAAIMCGVIHMKKYKIKQERRRLELQINYATVDRRTFAPNHAPTVKEGNLICMEPHTHPNIPNPATEKEPIWKSPLPDPHENDTSYPAQCAGATLPGHVVSADRWNNLQEQAPLQGSTLGPKYCPLDN